MLKHNLEPTENLGSGGRRRGSRKDKDTTRDDPGQNQNMGLDGEEKGKTVGDCKQRKLSPLRLSISNNQAGSTSTNITPVHPITHFNTAHVTCLDFVSNLTIFFCQYTFIYVVYACRFIH